MYVYDQQYFFPNENRIAFLIDDESDLASLPTTTSSGVPQEGGNVTNEPVDAGSLAYSIATSKKYILNTSDQWLEFKAPGGGGGSPSPSAANLSDLGDVSIVMPTDGDFLVYSPIAGKWINKKADTVIVNYEMIDNKPTINNTELDGDLSLEDIGINTITNEQMADLLALLDI